jgi:c-di-GMP-binding flagellar brake protein YcgR
MGFNGQERRKYVRVPDPLPVKFRLMAKGDPGYILDWTDCQTRDISTGGACIEIENIDKEKGDVIGSGTVIFELEITLPSQKKIVAKGNMYFVKVLGESVWNHYIKEKLKVGIRFIEISGESEKQISEYIVQQYLDSYGK